MRSGHFSRLISHQKAGARSSSLSLAAFFTAAPQQLKTMDLTAITTAPRTLLIHPIGSNPPAEE